MMNRDQNHGKSGVRNTEEKKIRMKKSPKQDLSSANALILLERWGGGPIPPTLDQTKIFNLYGL